MAQVAKLTPLDTLAVGDKIYSKVIFNPRQAQALPPSSEEYIILDTGGEFRFYPDGSIYFKRGTATPEVLFTGSEWVKTEVMVSGVVSEIYLHQDPVNGSPAEGEEEVEGAYYPNAHPHVNYGWFDKALDPNLSPNFIDRDKYENCGLPNEQFLITVKRMSSILCDLVIAYTNLATDYETLEARVKALES